MYVYICIIYVLNFIFNENYLYDYRITLFIYDIIIIFKSYYII